MKKCYSKYVICFLKLCWLLVVVTLKEYSSSFCIIVPPIIELKLVYDILVKRVIEGMYLFNI